MTDEQEAGPAMPAALQACESQCDRRYAAAGDAAPGAGEAVLCGYCGKPIEGSPVIGNGAPYHDGCWAEEGDF
jgi:hypothetical protein